MSKTMEKEPIKIFLVGSVIIISLWLINIPILNLLYPALAEKASFGDSFGAINALFSGLAFAGVIYTIHLQRKDLKLQRDEIRETRKEFEKQNRTMKLQRFEATFFNMLSIHNEIINATSYTHNSIEFKDTYTKRGFFKYIFTKLHRDLERIDYKNSSHNINCSIGIYKKTIYDEFNAELGHYFRNLYRILKLVDETVFITKDDLEPQELERKSPLEIASIVENQNGKERYKYSSIVRAQLSDYELYLLFYNCLSINGVEKFKPIIDKYAMFDNMPQNMIADERLLFKYEESAYDSDLIKL